MTTQTTGVVDNRDATSEDGIVLGRIYGRLAKLTKDSKTTARNVADGWIHPDSLKGLREERDSALALLDKYMDQAWATLKSLPKGTVASGGATPQTVALEFFNRNLNRNLDARITAADAKKINRKSFG